MQYLKFTVALGGGLMWQYANKFHLLPKFMLKELICSFQGIKIEIEFAPLDRDRDKVILIQDKTQRKEFSDGLEQNCKLALCRVFDAETSELVLPRRGRISGTAQVVADILNLPNKGGQVKYELDVDAINFVHEKYGIIHGSAPKIEEIVERVQKNKEANENFLRPWLMIAVSTFLCPPTNLGIRPRCYPALVDLSSVKKLNWCQFVVDQLKDAAKKIDKKNSMRGWTPLLVALIQNHKLDMAAVTQVFRKDTNHLGHCQLVTVPVLQMLVPNNENSGH
ncbi:hypothetical protein C2845_PM01G43640 [Panicum miliaceum]|uniref:Uncharacterized protein n=1 Tax=Panicum miliaceum TaxID=4540 RepID=A0A3L6TRD2_PANMI|nr:hypothetical protein C2845_PM01G43640 [Panicum miliaceum]